MSAPTPTVRAGVHDRDGHRCVACNTTVTLTFQHRRAVGMGGNKQRPDAVDGLTLCLICNMSVEAEMQTLALYSGWKVRKWADPSRVPVYYPHEFSWHRLIGDAREPITGPVAVEMMHDVYGHEWFEWRAEVNG